MTRVSGQELVVHLYAPVDGPRAAAGWVALREVWSRCGRLLGTTDPITETGLPTAFPDTPGQAAMAAAEGRGGDFQVVLRRYHEEVNLSVAMAPADAGWVEAHRWWAEVRADATEPLTAEVVVSQGRVAELARTAPAEVAAAALLALPRDARRARWPEAAAHGTGFLVWEPDATVLPDRHLVVVADETQDRDLSTWTWSDGGTTLPPLARYLLHAGNLRHHARVWDRERRSLAQLRGAVDTTASQARQGFSASVLARLRDLEAELLFCGTRARRMSRAVSTEAALMGVPLPGDRGRADWLLAELSATIAALAESAALAKGTRELGHDFTAPPPLDHPEAPTKVRATPRKPTTATRIGFALDIVGYGTRPPERRSRLQDRLLAIVQDVLAHLDLDISDTDHQGAGDGLFAFLPPSVDATKALNVFLRQTTARLEEDNDEFRDPIRLRLAATTGPVGLAALGFAGDTPTVLGRLLDSPPVRAEARTRDLAAIIADRLYHLAVDEPWRPDFTKHTVQVKDFTADAWLWRPAQP
ncbi:BN6_48550 family protein [Actinokineospora auranticolor]|uniref:Class 3 adenylate cyclase n=1 Tax=Actinokineospora auranticolor TaxID=155976 RepID=A0A2S6GT20_9PSEU|nr:CATRA conflict system CASPASE/TPR repeat-associated protein [Actinokineospora auranticolor]PPK68323.1 hypothetical protein CLV40_10546 [Actinokineospora auranticolor]